MRIATTERTDSLGGVSQRLATLSTGLLARFATAMRSPFAREYRKQKEELAMKSMGGGGSS